MNRSYTKGRVSSKAKNASKSKPLTQKNDFHKEWFDNMSAQEIFMTSRDGLRLSALLVDNFTAVQHTGANINRQTDAGTEGNSVGHKMQFNTGKFAILCHGYTGYPEEMGYQAMHFYEKGYSILCPAARAHGNSQGNIIGMGWKERLDICDWISLINKRYDYPEIVLYGISMGGGTVMMVSGEDLPSNVRCIIEDCGYSSVYSQYKHSLVKMMKLPAFPFMIYIWITARLVCGINLLKEGYATKQLAKSNIPVFFAHGTDDRYVPFSMLEENYTAHPGPKEKFIVENAPHIACPWMGGDEYWEHIFTFIGRFVSY